MKLFLKHIFRDIKKFPVQPILILLTLILSVSCAVTAFRAQDMFKDHIKEVSEANSELGDILISAGSSDTRVMFESDAKKALGDSAAVLGDFRLTGIIQNLGGEPSISISATDLVSADRYFEFHYTDYGKFTVQNLYSSAIISKTFAENADIDIEDTLTVSVLGKDYEYRVEAIAENTGLLTNVDMIVSIEGVKSRLSEMLPAIGNLNGDITPYSRLMIKAIDGSNTNRMIEELKNLPEFSGYRIESTRNSSQKDFLTMIQTGAVWLIAAVIILLAAILTGTALKLLESKRRLQYAAFSAAGATRSQIHFLRYTESAIYSVIGAIFGILLAIPMTKAIGTLFEWNEKTLTIGTSGIIFGAIFSPALILLCTALHLHKQKTLTLSEQLFTEEDEKSSGEKLSKKALLLWGIPTAISLATIFFIPTSKRFISSIISIPLVLKLAYIIIPPTLRSLSAFFADSLLKCKKCFGNAILLSRSFDNKYALRHVSRLTVLLVSLLFSVNVCRTALTDATDLMQSVVSADIAAVGVGESLATEIKNDPCVDSVVRIGAFSGTELPYGYTLTALSAKGDIGSCINQEIIPKKLPKGYETILSSGVAKLCNVETGDTITLRIKGAEYKLTVIEIINTGFTTVFIDADGLGIGMDTVCLKFSESAKNNAELQNDLISRIEANGAATIEPKYLFGTATATAKGFISLMEYATVAAAMLTLVGCINTLASFYRSREREFGILRLSGMSSVKLICFISLEFITLIFVSLILSVPTVTLLCTLINTALNSFGFSIFI